MNCEPKYLIVKGSGGGGLGDRIRSVLTGIVYAKLTNRTIYIDWSDGKLIPERRNVFNELFRLKNIDYVNQTPVSDDVLPSIWRGKLDTSLHELYEQSGFVNWDRQAAIEKFSFDQRHLHYPQAILVMWEFDQLARFSNHYSVKYGNALMRAIAAEHLCLNDQITDEIQQYKKSAYSAHEKIIAVHIRATNEFRQQKSTVDLGQYVAQIKRCMHSLSQQAADGQIIIFLATDNSDVERRLRKEFPGLLRTREKWFADPGERIHFNRQCPDADRSLRDAIIEICLLAESEYLIYQHNSSFGMIADYFFKSHEDNVFRLVPSVSLVSKLKSRIKKTFAQVSE